MMAFTRSLSYNTAIKQSIAAAFEAPCDVRHSEVAPCLSTILPRSTFTSIYWTKIAQSASGIANAPHGPLSFGTRVIFTSSTALPTFTKLAGRIMWSADWLQRKSVVLIRSSLSVLFHAIDRRKLKCNYMLGIRRIVFAANGLSFRLTNSIICNHWHLGETVNSKLNEGANCTTRDKYYYRNKLGVVRGSECTASFASKMVQL